MKLTKRQNKKQLNRKRKISKKQRGGDKESERLEKEYIYLEKYILEDIAIDGVKITGQLGSNSMFYLEPKLEELTEEKEKILLKKIMLALAAYNEDSKEFKNLLYFLMLILPLSKTLKPLQPLQNN